MCAGLFLRRGLHLAECPFLYVLLGFLALSEAAEPRVLGKLFEVFLTGREVSYLLVLLELLTRAAPAARAAAPRRAGPASLPPSWRLHTVNPSGTECPDQRLAPDRQLRSED